MDELTDAVKKTLIQRINTPLFGFVVLSWFGFNWSNFLIVLMGDGKLQDRIVLVKGEPDILLDSLVYPFFCGFVVAVIFPYLSHIVSFLQRYAQIFADFNDRERAKLECTTKKELARYNADAESEHAYQMAIFARRNAEEEQKTVDINFNVAKVKEECDSVRNTLQIEEEKLSNTKIQCESLEVKIKSATAELEAIISKLGPYEKINSKIEEDKRHRMANLEVIDDAVVKIINETSRFGFRVNANDEDTPYYDPATAPEITTENAKSAFRVISHAGRVINEFMPGAGYQRK